METFECLEVLDRHALAGEPLRVEHRLVAIAQHPPHLPRRGARPAGPERDPRASRLAHDRTEAERPRPLPRIHGFAESRARRGGVSQAVALDFGTQSTHRPGVLHIPGDDHLVDHGSGERRVVGVGQDTGLRQSRHRAHDREHHGPYPSASCNARAGARAGDRAGRQTPSHARCPAIRASSVREPMGCAVAPTPGGGGGRSRDLA